MMEQIDYINKIDLYFERSEEWKLIGYWPKILDRIYILDRNMDSILENEPYQCYLDSSLYNAIQSSNKKVAESKRRIPIQLKLPI